MQPSKPASSKRKPMVWPDFLVGVLAGFLLNIVLGLAVQNIGYFIAGVVAGTLTRRGVLTGAAAGLLAGTVFEILSLATWFISGIVIVPANSDVARLIAPALTSSIVTLTTVQAILSLAGGVVGGVLASSDWMKTLVMLRRRQPLLETSGAEKTTGRNVEGPSG